MTTRDCTKRARKSAEVARLTIARKATTSAARGGVEASQAFAQLQDDRPEGFTGALGWVESTSQLISGDWVQTSGGKGAQARSFLMIRAREDGRTELV